MACADAASRKMLLLFCASGRVAASASAGFSVVVCGDTLKPTSQTFNIKTFFAISDWQRSMFFVESERDLWPLRWSETLLIFLTYRISILVVKKTCSKASPFWYLKMTFAKCLVDNFNSEAKRRWIFDLPTRRGLCNACMQLCCVAAYGTPRAAAAESSLFAAAGPESCGSGSGGTCRDKSQVLKGFSPLFSESQWNF